MRFRFGVEGEEDEDFNLSPQVGGDCEDIRPATRPTANINYS